MTITVASSTVRIVSIRLLSTSRSSNLSRFISRVRVRCPVCQNMVEVVTNAYSVIHNADPDKHKWGEILQILPPDPKTSEESIRRNIRLHYQVYEKKSSWRPG